MNAWQYITTNVKKPNRMHDLIFRNGNTGKTSTHAVQGSQNRPSAQKQPGFFV